MNPRKSAHRDETDRDSAPSRRSRERGQSSPSAEPTNARQTQTYLRGLFQERGLSPKSKLGQNFLIDLNLIDLIVSQAELSRQDLVLEVGTGTGSLTAHLAEHAGAVLSVEIDPNFYGLAQENLEGLPHVRLIHADVLRNKNNINPEIFEALERGKEQGNFANLKLIANLPYAVATPVISNLLLTDLNFERMVVTVQWEIAQRLLAKPGNKNFGALTVLVQSISYVSLVRRLPSAVFWPRPQVASAIVRITPKPHKRARFTDVQGFRNFLRDLYAHRRKNLRGGLLAMPNSPREKQLVDEKLVEMELDPSCRAETLDVPTHRRLFEAFGSWAGK